MKSVLIFLSILIPFNTRAGSRDRYANFADLARHEKEGQAYHVDVLNRRAKVTIVAIHGGKIEAGTDEIAREVAGADLNLYAFIATLAENNHRLHITSTHFDDPRAIDLVRAANYVISIHGFKETSEDRICVGGGNGTRLEHLAGEIKKSGLALQVESPCKQFGGSDHLNIVNRGTEPGVQLELSTHLRDRLQTDSELRRRLVTLIRAEALL